ncbi:hypothetical protein M1M87_00470, partial [Thermodesulfovibrionales bacterium]|nr:hypothetical protein [Thermodesulfovibrionales bacterium]
SLIFLGPINTTYPLETLKRQKICIRSTSEAEWFHETIYDALELAYCPLPPKRITAKVCSPHKKRKT